MSQAVPLTAIGQAPPQRLRPRHPLLVVVWTFGLFVLVHTTQYVYFWLASRATGTTFDAVASGRVETATTLFLRGLVALALGIPATFLVTRLLWRRSSAWMRSQPNLGLFVTGSALGLLSVAAIVAIMMAGGLVQLSLPAHEAGRQGLLYAQVGIAGWAVFTAVLEEYVFRGMVTREMAVRWGWPLATLAAGVYFGASHLIAVVPLLTPAMVLGILAFGLVAHALFAALYVRSSSLWLPIGFHASWNFALTGLFGTAMSAQKSTYGLLQMDVSGPPFLTGGTWGIESSPVAGLVMALLVPSVLYLFRRGGPGLLPAREE